MNRYNALTAKPPMKEPRLGPPTPAAMDIPVTEAEASGRARAVVGRGLTFSLGRARLGRTTAARPLPNTAQRNGPTLRTDLSDGETAYAF